MAQIYKIRRRGVGAYIHEPRLTGDEALALATLAGGLVSAYGIYLYATKRHQEAYAIGISSGIVTAFIAAAKLLGDSGSAQSPA